jgi:cytochrome c-type biogenesis protein CcmF
MSELGRAALAVALGLILYAAVAGGYAAHVGRRRLLASARNALLAAVPMVGVAVVVLLAALARHDFSFIYVAEHASRELPLGYSLAAFWSGQEGSLLLWVFVLVCLVSAAVVLNPRLCRDVLPWTVPIAAAITTFFLLLLNFVATPFATQTAPTDGAGLNPSLQNPYMLAHPPVLYLGFVGLTVPFAFAMAALVSRRLDERWIVATRRWTLGSWTFLGFAILLGSKWAYEEVGWGGWYAWDPVENAALMPWLVATAYLHSVMVQEKKDMLRVWNVVLVAGAFTLSLFGTFLTRSGVISSIHSFTQSSIGPWFLGFIAVVAAASVTLILVRLPLLRARTRLESLVSREAAFLYNNLFLVALALTILWGVLYPIVSEAVRGVAVTVGAPYYNFFGLIFGLPLVLLMGVGPLVAWRRASLRALGTSLLWPAGAALLGGAALVAAGAGSSAIGVIGYTFGFFVLGAIVLEFARGARARHALGDRWHAALAGLVARNRRRYGGYVVHAAIVLLLIGAVGVGAYGSKDTAKLAPGQTMRAGEYTLRNDGVTQRRGANAQEIRVRLAVARGADDLGLVAAGKNRYLAEEQTSNEVAIRTDWLHGEDLFVIADQFNADGSVFLEVVVNPLVNLIWLAGLVFVLGALITMWPDAREQRRLERRLADQRAFAH